jgi:hypothetical protein
MVGHESPVQKKIDNRSSAAYILGLIDLLSGKQPAFSNLR